MAEGISIKWNTAAFNRALKAYFASVGADAEEICRSTAGLILSKTKGATAVDTGSLQRAWSGPTKVGNKNHIKYRIFNNRGYAGIVEFGLYPRVGKSKPPKTVSAGGASFGFGYTAPSGIYSTQSVHGMLTKSVASEYTNFNRRIKQSIRTRWVQRGGKA
jgi:hypothetical protein